MIQKLKSTKLILVIVFFVISFVFVANLSGSVYAQFGASVTPDSGDAFDSKIETPAEQNNRGITGEEINDAIKGCSVSSLGDTQLFSPFQFIAEISQGAQFSDYLCEVENGNVAGIQDAQKQGINFKLNSLTAQIVDQRPASAIKFAEEKVYALQNALDVNAQIVKEPSDLYYPGTGFALLAPVQAFWGWSVNIVYGLLIFLIIIVAFAIMFRAKLGGATAVTIQNAIPNIALAMILVPLSYAISGLFIDAITVGTNVVHEFLIGEGSPGRVVYETRNCSTDEIIAGKTSDATNPDDRCIEFVDEVPLPDGQSYEGLSQVGYVGELPPDRGLFPDDVRLDWIQSRDQLAINDELNALVNSTTGPTDQFTFIQTLVQLLNGGAEGSDGWIGDVVNFIVSFVLLWTGLRIFFKLISKYLVFLFGPVMAPFFFATVAIPGNGTKSVMSFVKMMGAASLFYIVTYAMFLLGAILSNYGFQSQIPDIGTTGYVPPLLGIDGIIQTLNSSGNIDATWIGFMLSLAAVVLYLRIPATLDSIDEKLGGNSNPLFDLIGDSWSSAKDSVNLARRTIAAPGKGLQAAGRAGQTAARSVIYGKAQSAGWNQKIKNLSDRYIKGYRPGEQGSSLYKRQQELRSTINNLERERAAATNPVTRQKKNFAIEQARAELDQISKASKGSSLYDSSKTFTSELTKEVEGKGGKLTAQIDYVGKPVYEVDEPRYEEIATYPTNGTFAGAYKDMSGKLKFKAENVELTPYIKERMAVYAVNNNQESDLISGGSAGARINTIEFAKGGTPTINDLFTFPSRVGPQYIHVYASPINNGDIHAVSKDQWEVSIVLAIYDSAAFARDFKWPNPSAYIPSNKVIFAFAPSRNYQFPDNGKDLEKDVIQSDPIDFKIVAATR